MVLRIEVRASGVVHDLLRYTGTSMATGAEIEDHLGAIRFPSSPIHRHDHAEAMMKCDAEQEFLLLLPFAKSTDPEQDIRVVTHRIAVQIKVSVHDMGVAEMFTQRQPGVQRSLKILELMRLEDGGDTSFLGAVRHHPDVIR